MTDEPAADAPDLGRFRLKRPCKHCPFRNDETRIRFRCRDRAVEILQLKANGDGAPWPAIDNDERLLNTLALHLEGW